MKLNLKCISSISFYNWMGSLHTDRSQPERRELTKNNENLCSHIFFFFPFFFSFFLKTSRWGPVHDFTNAARRRNTGIASITHNNEAQKNVIGKLIYSSGSKTITQLNSLRTLNDEKCTISIYYVGCRYLSYGPGVEANV